MTKKIPIVYCYKRTDCDGLMFMCKYCNKIHRHGKGDGHRGAHCMEGNDNRTSPYNETGYHLILNDKKLEILDDYMEYPDIKSITITEVQKIKKVQKCKETIHISIRIDIDKSKWMKDNNVSPTALFNKALEQIGFNGKSL